MASVAISIGGALLKTILHANEMWGQRMENKEVAEELTHFIRDLQVNLKALEAKRLAINNTSAWTMAALKVDLEKANGDAENILKMGFIKKLWDSKKIKEELRFLRERVMTSFQVKLLYLTLDVTLDSSKNQEEFLAAMSRVQQELNRTHAETSAENLKEIKNVIRRELQQMWHPVQTEMRAKGDQSVEGAIQVIKGTGFQAQTDDTEKFFADVLMELENAMRGSSRLAPVPPSTSGEGSGGSNTETKPGGIKWYHDPITWDIMCDPVKGSDGRTYDRWTLLDNSSSMKRSPFDPGQEQPLKVEFDDISVRSQLFHKFPEQGEKCKARRREYREEAMRKAGEGFVGDALVMLNHVLEWAAEDSECRATRDEMKGLVDGDLTILDGGVPWPAADLGSSASSAHTKLESLMVVDTSLCDTKTVAISTDNLTVTTLTDAAVCFRTTSPCPPGSSFYFEMQVKDAGANGRVAIGFSTGTSFKPNRLPGLYDGSWAYKGYQYPVADTASVVKGREPLCSSDTVGAGLLHTSRLIYFIHNGTLLGAVTVDDSIDLAGLHPTFGLHDQHAKVTLNFGARDFMPQQKPTMLDRESCTKEALDEGFISISGEGMEARFMKGAEVVAVRADSPAPCRLPSYYFELQVKNAGQHGWIAIGFTGFKLPFRSDNQPGWLTDSAGYHGDDGGFFSGSSVGYTRSGPTFTSGDTVGAGIFYDTDEIFYRKNGVLVGTFSRSSVFHSGLLFPTIGLHSPGECVRVNFGETPFMPEVLPSELKWPAQPPRPGRGPLAAQADHCVPVGGDFYFELQVTSSLQDNGLAIGFTNLEHFRDDKQPGVYAGSCGYHQDGSLYCGGRHLSEHDAFGAGDTVGAGVLRGRNTIFFTRNGKLIASVDYLSVFSSLQVYPTVGTLDKQAFRIHFFDDVASMASRIPQGIPSPTRRLPGIPVPVVTSLSLTEPGQLALPITSLSLTEPGQLALPIPLPARRRRPGCLHRLCTCIRDLLLACLIVIFSPVLCIWWLLNLDLD